MIEPRHKRVFSCCAINKTCIQLSPDLITPVCVEALRKTMTAAIQQIVTQTLQWCPFARRRWPLPDPAAETLRHPAGSPWARTAQRLSADPCPTRLSVENRCKCGTASKCRLTASWMRKRVCGVGLFLCSLPVECAPRRPPAASLRGALLVMWV